MCTKRHVYAHVHTETHVHVLTYSHAHTRAHTDTHAHAHAETHTCTCSHMCTSTHAHAQLWPCGTPLSAGTVPEGVVPVPVGRGRPLPALPTTCSRPSTREGFPAPPNLAAQLRGHPAPLAQDSLTLGRATGEVSGLRPQDQLRPEASCTEGGHLPKSAHADTQTAGTQGHLESGHRVIN